MNQRLVVVLSCLSALGGLGLIALATEWEDTVRSTPARGEAATNPLYATQALIRDLGGEVASAAALDTMPPPGVRLVLTSPHWSLRPGHAQMLRDWVEAGGQLIASPALVDAAAVKPWMPMTQTPASISAPTDKPTFLNCRTLKERRSRPPPPAAAGAATFDVCGRRSPLVYTPVGRTGSPTWWVESIEGVEAMRVPVGRGSVTVLGAWGLMDNAELMKEGSARLVSAALQVRPGAVYWFVADRPAQAFVPWLWRVAWPAWALGLLALAAALWRAMPRFGAMAAPALVARRSMAEQVRGTGRFLHRHGAVALHAAQVRALEEGAHPVFHGFAHADEPRRSAWLAQATGLDASALALALGHAHRSRSAMARDLALIETARRRLRAPGLARESTTSYF